jgi:ABC-type branched-subunit amino acid transport system ATPase component
MRIATYGYVMERGSIAAEGAADRLLHSDVIRQSYLGKI